MDKAGDWAVALFRKSVLKQRKLAEITALLGPTLGLRCLDLGSDNGVVSQHGSPDQPQPRWLPNGDGQGGGCV